MVTILLAHLSMLITFLITRMFAYFIILRWFIILAPILVILVCSNKCLDKTTHFFFPFLLTLLQAITFKYLSAIQNHNFVSPNQFHSLEFSIIWILIYFGDAPPLLSCVITLDWRDSIFEITMACTTFEGLVSYIALHLKPFYRYPKFDTCSETLGRRCSILPCLWFFICLT